MKKNAPKILAVILLTVIAVLMLVAGSGSIRNFFNSFKADATEKTDDNDPVIIEPPGGDPEEEPKSVFPKLPKNSEIYIYEQDLELSGGTLLNAVHQTAQGSYIVLTVNPPGGDLKVSQKTVCVVRMGGDGSLLSAINLNFDGESEYLASEITAAGLAVVVNSGEKTYAATVNPELTKFSQIEIQKAEKARIFPYSEGFLLLAKSRENTLYLIEDSAIAKTTSVQAGEIVDIYEMAAYFILVINGVNGYSVINLDKNLYGYTSVSLPEKTALKICPVAENGVQKYIVAEKEGNAVYLAKYEKTFRSAEDRICLGLSDSAEVYINRDTIFVLLKNGSGRIYLSDLALNISLSSAEYFSNISGIFYCNEYNDGYLMLCADKSEENLVFIDLRNNGSVSQKNLAADTHNACFVRNLDGSAAVFFINEGGLKIVCMEI